VKVPPSFKLLAQKFGLPEEHLDFFFENRKHFNWEIKENRKIYCTIRGCDFAAPVAPGALVHHMIDLHEYGQYPFSCSVYPFLISRNLFKEAFI